MKSRALILLLSILLHTALTQATYSSQINSYGPLSEKEQKEIEEGISKIKAFLSFAENEKVFKQISVVLISKINFI